MSGDANAENVSANAVQSSVGSIVPGNIIQVDFPHVRPRQLANGVVETSKLRPALVLYVEKYQLVVAYISSKTENSLNPADVLVLDNSPSFKETGLLRSSVIRLGVLATIPLNKEKIKGLYGSANIGLRNEINGKLAVCYKI